MSTTAATAEGTETLRTPAQPTVTYASLARRTALLRDHVDLTQSDVRDLHRETQLGALDESTSVVALQDPSELVDALAQAYGLSWTSIARLVGVSDAAVRKWRRGEAVSADNRRHLARAVAFLQTLADTYPVRDVGSWLEMPISDEATVTALDIYRDGRIDLLFEMVGSRLAPRRVLDAYDPNWRTSYGVDKRFSIATAPDGEPVVIERRQEEGRPLGDD